MYDEKYNFCTTVWVPGPDFILKCLRLEMFEDNCQASDWWRNVRISGGSCETDSLMAPPPAEVTYIYVDTLAVDLSFGRSVSDHSLLCYQIHIDEERGCLDILLQGKSPFN